MPAEWSGTYEGTIGGRYAVRVQLRQEADTLWRGQYYYLSQGKLLALRGRRQPDGQLLLRESGSAEARLTGVFRLQLAANGTLGGTWQDAGRRAPLPVQLRRSDGSQPRLCQLQLTERTYFDEYAVPVVRVADAGVTRRLRQRFAIETVAELSLAELKEEHDNLGADYPQGYHDLHYEVGYRDNCLLSLTFRSESVGANVNTTYEDVTVDLVTGFELDILGEIAPERQQAFLTEGDRRLHQQIRGYIRDEGGVDAESAAGLNAQVFAPESMFIRGDTVQLHHNVEFEELSNFEWKNYNHQFFAAFSAAELLPYLRPDSPLRRLARPTARR
ncbi:hypothetical protein B0919_15170 [Hymenobacter sp. CRA2]|nr:hypothetical protein B0919_15170 [Hymenobacter sp. CRA2]